MLVFFPPLNHLLHDQDRQVRILCEEDLRFFREMLPQSRLQEANSREHFSQEGIHGTDSSLENLAGLEDGRDCSFDAGYLEASELSVLRDLDFKM